MLLCAISESAQLSEELAARRSALLRLAAEWSAGGVDFLQLREKDLAPAELAALAAALAARLRQAGGRTRLLVNTSVEAAAFARAGGVHLPGGWSAASVAAARGALAEAGVAGAIVSLACHSAAEAAAARAAGADMVLFAPVFAKTVAGGTLAGAGIEGLRAAVGAAGPLPVLALGGVEAAHARDCLQAGAAGIAGIRLFRRPGWQALKGQG